MYKTMRIYSTVHLTTGDVSIGRPPFTRIKASPKNAQGNGILDWFEEFAQRLDSKMYVYSTGPSPWELEPAAAEGIDDTATRCSPVRSYMSDGLC